MGTTDTTKEEEPYIRNKGKHFLQMPSIQVSVIIYSMEIGK